jgi:hypothetical protein
MRVPVREEFYTPNRLRFTLFRVENLSLLAPYAHSITLFSLHEIYSIQIMDGLDSDMDF